MRVISLSQQKLIETVPITHCWLDMVNLAGLFTSFCEYFDGKLSYSTTSTSEWTELVLKFFGEQAKKDNAVPVGEYMLVDQIWRGQHSEIVFALEHEHSGSDVNELLNKEVNHLIDLRAKAKVGIFYPNLGDEKTLVDNISSRILYRSLYNKIPFEEYMFILGFATRKQGHPAIMFKAYFFNDSGKKTDHREFVIRQAQKTETT